MREAKIRLAIIEDDVQLLNGIAEYLERFDIFELVGIAHDGIAGTDLLRRDKVDVFLLDPTLPRRNGLCVLQELMSDPLPHRPSCIVLSSIGGYEIENHFKQLNVAHYILKPFDLELLVCRIIEVYNSRSDVTVSLEAPVEAVQKNHSVMAGHYVMDLVQNGFGIRNHLKGYNYLKTAILFSIENNTLLDSITKHLYPAVAKEHGTTSANVERAVRHALGSTKQGDIRMTNSQFIKFIVEQYHLSNT